MNNCEKLNTLLTAKNRIYIVASGAGAGLQNILWQVPGISAVLVGAEFPYAPEATDKFLGFKPAKYCSEDTAISLALEAYSRAFVLNGAAAVGLGLTASVASTVAHRGAHRVFIAVATKNGVKAYSEILVKGVGMAARIQDGDKCDALALTALAEPEALVMTDATDKATKLFFEHPYFLENGERGEVPETGNGLVLFPGAFNPPHEGHKWLARASRGIFHITTNPPHKPALNVIELVERAKLLDGYARIFTQDDPLYLDKARKFPGAKIIVGVDALIRMLDPKWGVEITPLLNEFRALGTKFLVADREVNGQVETLFHIAGAPLDICKRINNPTEHYKMSSTALRNGIGK